MGLKFFKNWETLSHSLSDSKAVTDVLNVNNECKPVAAAHAVGTQRRESRPPSSRAAGDVVLKRQSLTEELGTERPVACRRGAWCATRHEAGESRVPLARPHQTVPGDPGP